MELNDYVRALRRGWWVVALTAVVFGAVAAALVGDRTIRVTGRVVIGPSSELARDEVRSAVASNIDEAVLNTFSDVATSREVLDRAALRVGHGDDRDEVGSRIGTRSRVVDVWVDGQDREAARRLNRVVIREAIAFFEDLYPVYRVEVIQSPTRGRAVGLSTLQAGLVAAVLGAGLGAGIVLSREWLSARARHR
jgi:uncharacterized protein involved in exopolysaccharide biosynthesis